MTTAIESLFQPLTIEQAPEAAKPILEQIKKGYGFIPNLMATFANNPVVLQGYLALDGVFEKGSFTPVERQIIFLAASVVNNCNYCTAAHSTVAKSFLNVPAEVVAAIRGDATVPDAKLDALVRLTKEIVSERGYAEQNTIDTFLAAGYNKGQVMELLLGVALKTISNYLDHLSPTAIDPAFAQESR